MKLKLILDFFKVSIIFQSWIIFSSNKPICTLKFIIVYPIFSDEPWFCISELSPGGQAKFDW